MQPYKKTAFLKQSLFFLIQFMAKHPVLRLFSKAY